MKITSKSFGNYYLEYNYQGVNVMDSKGTIQKVQNLMQGIEIIVQKRMFDEFPENVDVRDYVNKETSIRNEIKNEFGIQGTDETNSMFEQNIQGSY